MSDKSTGDHVRELKDLVVAYAKQETIDPLKTLGRYLGFGFAGSILIGGGVALLLLALLRGLQQIDVFVDPAEFGMSRFSWAPYLITAVVAFVLMGLFIRKFMQAISSVSEPHDTSAKVH